MMQGTTGNPVQKEETKMQFLLKEYLSQTNIADNHIARIESVGHRINNTNYPSDAKGMAKDPSPTQFDEGAFRDFENLNKTFLSLNYRLNEIATKLEGLI